VREIRFEDVEFEYRPGRPVVRDFSVTVPGGSVIALVGRSGAGKTTVTDLVARFHDPTHGRLLLNGEDIRDLRLKSYRHLLALVQQDVFLFDGSVRDNIAYGGSRPATPRSRMRRAGPTRTSSSSACPRLRDLRGANGGEAVGRAAAAAGDRAGPAGVTADSHPRRGHEQPRHRKRAADSRPRWRRVLAGRTTFVIAHRLSTIRRADLILLMEDGRFIERGRTRS
jgi:ABC-type multidrug transport system fused ATPase/permease subunit